jgi:hypothetical protein
MDDQFQHPSALKLLAEVGTAFREKPIFQNKERPVIFLCGGPHKSRKRTIRREFLRWSNENFPDVVTLLAEDAYGHTQIYDPPETVNLSEFEQIIGSIADCVLLFPESEGSFAELGLFSNMSAIRKKTLVANPVIFQSKDSFVNLGPINSIDKNSYLSPTIQLVRHRGKFDFEPLRERLDRLTHRTQRKSFSYAPFNKLDHLGRLLIILEIINIFQFVTIESLGHCIRVTFGTAEKKQLRRILSILSGAGYIRQRDSFFSLQKGKRSLLEFEDIRIDSLKARALSYYEKYRPDLYRRFKRSLRWA